MLVKKFFIIVSLFFIQPHLAGLFTQPSFQESTKSSALSFLSGAEIRKKQLVTLDEELKTFKNEAQADRRAITENLNKINKDLTEVKEKLEGATKQADIDYLNKKITFLNDRKQNFLTSLDLLKEIEDVFTKRAKIITEIIEFLQGKQKKILKALYAWQEFRDAQAKVSETSSAIEEEKTKRDNLNKQIFAEKDTISSLQKQVEVKTKERDKTIGDAKIAEKTAINSTFPLKQTEDLFDEEINLLKEKIDLSQFKIEKITQEIKFKDDVIDLHENQFSDQKSTLMLIEKRLFIDVNDVESAKTESAVENQKALHVKDELTKRIDAKKFEKNRLDVRIEILGKQLKDLESKGKKDSVDYYITKSELKKEFSYHLSLETELELLHARVDLADDAVNTKELLYHMVDLRYKLISGKEDLDELLAKFKNQKDLALTILKRLTDKRKEAMDGLVASTKELEAIKAQEEVLFNKQDLIFKKGNIQFQTVLKNLEIAKKHLHEHLQISHEYLVINSDLIVSREKIISQYNLILQDLETRKVAQGVWKRSPKAISFDEFKLSLFEAETFFRQLFWDTPSHLGPNTLLTGLKKSTLQTSLGVLFFIIFFLIAFIGTRFGLRFLLKKMKLSLASNQKQTGFLPLNIAISLIEFALLNLKSLFSWCFIYLHILFNFKYIFSSIGFIAQSYYIAMFYIASIPILVYLARILLDSLKDLNKRLSFLFFAEKLQDRFLLLITSFCYSSAILIPFRQAFLSYYHDHQTILPDVILAAYSLILVVILLLFFGKDDVLRFIPSRYIFLIWLKKSVDKHYYPVFVFLMGLLVISNPYIGYLNLAWFLAFAVPLTTFIMYALFIAHYYTRKYALFLFIKEEEDEIIDKFEHAKTYYGFFVIFSFIILLGLAFLVSARIWGFPYGLNDIWKLLSDVWVIPIGATYKLGFVQLISLVIFIAGGFLVSSLLHKFILNKLFDILRTEPGTQNTISKILHYVTICMATLLGFIFIHLENLIWYIGTLFAVGLGLALKDILTDYVAGFFVLIERPIEIGHFIRLDNNPELQGTVHKIDARTTTIMTRLNHSLIIPNKDLVTKFVTNWGKGRFAIGLEIWIRVDYKSDAEFVRQTISEVIQSNPTILRVPRTIIRLDDFEESGLLFLARPFISSRRVQEQWNIAASLREDLFKAFREKNIIFAFPQHVIHMGGKDINGPKGSGSPIQFKFEQ